MKFLLALLAFLKVANGNVFGFGRNRLKKQHQTNVVGRTEHGHSNSNNNFHLLSSDNCDPVESRYYKGGVIDNFAALNDQGEFQPTRPVICLHHYIRLPLFRIV